MSRHFVLDFDGTLIDTEAYWNWVANQFFSFGVELERIRSAGEALFPFRYNVPQHARELGLAPHVVEEVSQRNHEYIQNHHASLIFPDVHPFLERFAYVQKSILTFGDEEHQMNRILRSGLRPHVQDVRIATPENPKIDLLTGLVETSPIPLVFIDDDVQQLCPIHNAGLPVELIRMRRPGQRQSAVNHELDHKAWRVVESFDEL